MPTIGNRLRQARVAAGFSQSELARRAAPLSAMAISKYERNLDTPRPSVLLRLAEALQVEPQYFYQPIRVELACVQYRKRRGLGPSACETVEERVREELEPYLEVESAFPAGWLAPPALRPEEGYAIGSLEEAEDAAAALRERWQLGTDPIENLPETLEDHGIKVLLIDAPEGFDGLSCWANGHIPVVVANKSKPWDRQRSDQAHELGELFLRPGPEVDRERAAQRFAGAFLVPRDTVKRELGARRAMLTFEELRLLKEEYGLSMAAWIFRARDAGVIGEATFKRLFQRLSALGLRKDEGTPARPPDQPARFRMLVYQAEAEGFLTPIRRAELLGELPEPVRPRPSDAEMRAAAERLRDYYATAG